MRKLDDKIVRLRYCGEWFEVMEHDDFGNYMVNMYGMPYFINIINVQAVESKEVWTIDD